MENKIPSQLEPWSDLEGKVVLVTGASAGLGREFCTDLAKAGCYIVAAARRADRLKSLCDEINEVSATTRAVAIELDVTAGRNTIEAAAQKAWSVFGRIDVLINNAGIRGTSLHLQMIMQVSVIIFLRFVRRLLSRNNLFIQIFRTLTFKIKSVKRRYVTYFFYAPHTYRGNKKKQRGSLSV